MEPIPMVPDITHLAIRPRRPMMEEEPRLRRQAIMHRAPLRALAEEPQQNVEAVGGRLEGEVVQHAARAAAADGVGERADGFLGVVVGARVLRVLLLEGKGLGEAPEGAFVGDGHVVAADDAALWHAGVVWEGEVHAAVADPEDIPSVAVGGRHRRHSLGEFVEEKIGNDLWCTFLGGRVSRVGKGVGLIA